MKTEILQPTKESIILAADEIKKGGLVAFATETVYGLGCNAFDSLAAKKIFTVKGRPSDNPLIVHLADIMDIKKVGFLPQNALNAVQSFMPGPLTVVIKKKACIPNEVTGGLDTVAIRIPNSETARSFIECCGVPIAAPSANTSTKPSCTTAQHVYDDLNGSIRYILDGGSCSVGLESTILDFSTDKIRLLRRGGIPIEELEKVLGKIQLYDQKEGERPLSPGMKYRHYAPNARLKLFDFEDTFNLLNEYNAAKGQGLRVRVLHCSKIDLASSSDCVYFDSVNEYASKLFFQLRWADEINTDLILCEKAPNLGLGASINSRLLKASGGN